MYKKRIGLATVLFMSTQYVSNATAQEINWWYEAAGAEQQQALKTHFVEPFNAKGGDQLNVTFSPNYDVKAQAALLANKGPDLILTSGPAILNKLAKSGKILSLDDYAKKYDWQDKVLKVMLDLSTIDGKLYSMPKTYETLMLFYNKTLFQENGWLPPKNYQELTELVEKMKAKNIIPLGGGNSGWKPTNEHWVTIVMNHCAGPEKVKQALHGEVKWTDPAFVQSINILNNWYQDNWLSSKDYYSINQEIIFDKMKKREVGMSMTGSWAFQWVDSYFGHGNDEFGVASIPSLCEGVPYPLYTLGIGASIAINANAKNKEGAADVINSLLNEDYVITMAKAWPGEWLSPIKKLNAKLLADATSEQFSNAVTDLVQAVNAGHYGYTTWTFFPAKTDSEIIEGIENVWSKKITVEQYLKNVQKVFDKDLKKGDVPFATKKN